MAANVRSPVDFTGSVEEGVLIDSSREKRKQPGDERRFGRQRSHNCHGTQ
jgi:hypothetical protein